MFSNAIGDTFMTLPTIRAFSSYFESVSIICSDVHFMLLQEIEFSNVFSLEISQTDLTSTLPDSTFQEIQKHRFDIFISLSSYHNFIIENLIESGSFEKSIGYAGECYDFEIVDPLSTTNMFDIYFKSFNYFNPEAKIEDYSNPIVPNELTLADTSSDRNFSIVTIHTDTKPNKSWDVKCFTELIKGIIGLDQSMLVVVIGIPTHDYSTISERVLQHNSKDFEISWQLLNMSSYFIGVDSCFLHLADINKIPSIALFGPSNELEWGFKFNEQAVVIKGIGGDINNISVESVLSKFKENFNSSIKKKTH